MLLRLPVNLALLVLVGCAGGAPGLVLNDLDGRAATVLPAAGPGPSVFIFLGADCPVSNRYAPEIDRLRRRCARDGAEFRIVYPGTRFTIAELRKHREDWLPGCAALLDPGLKLAKACGVRATPEAAVFAPGRGLVYHGRIDDWYAEPGVRRPAPTTRELQEALDALARGQAPPTASAPAVGCPLP